MRILHCFKWKAKDIKNNMENIREQHFDTVLTTPVQPHKEINMKYYDNEWWKYYQPLSFSIGNDLCSKQDLIDLCNEAHRCRINIIVDVVLNHVSNKSYGDDELIPSDDVDSIIRDNKWFFKERRRIMNWDSEYENTHYCPNLPSLNLDNWELQDIIKQFLDELIECGVDGFRIDAGKHIGLPRDGISFYERIIKPYKDSGKIIMSEVINTNRELIDAYSEYGLVLTNTTDCDHNKMITFASSHDSELNEDLNMAYTKNLDESIIMKDYIELTKYYPNTLYFPRKFSSSWLTKEIREANMR